MRKLIEKAEENGRVAAGDDDDDDDDDDTAEILEGDVVPVGAKRPRGSTAAATKRPRAGVRLTCPVDASTRIDELGEKVGGLTGWTKAAPLLAAAASAEVGEAAAHVGTLAKATLQQVSAWREEVRRAANEMSGDSRAAPVPGLDKLMVLVQLLAAAVGGGDAGDAGDAGTAGAAGRVSGADAEMEDLGDDEEDDDGADEEEGQLAEDDGDEGDDEDEWAVDQILKEKTEGGQKLFLVSWEGFGVEDDSWEPLTNIVRLGSEPMPEPLVGTLTNSHAPATPPHAGQNGGIWQP